MPRLKDGEMCDNDEFFVAKELFSDKQGCPSGYSCGAYGMGLSPLFLMVF
jgi:hypothetical protein